MSKLSDPTEWMRFAHDDLAAARLLLAEATLPPRLACFHAQQAAEKVFKAALVNAGLPFRKTHDLIVLAQLQPEPVRTELATVDLERLQQWAVDARYPADLPEIDAQEAASIVAIAERVVSIIAVYVNLSREA